MPCRIFLELFWLLHDIVCAVFLGFKTENPGWLVITWMNAMHNFFWNQYGYCILLYVLFFWVLRLKIQVGLLLLE